MVTVIGSEFVGAMKINKNANDFFAKFIGFYKEHQWNCLPSWFKEYSRGKSYMHILHAAALLALVTIATITS